MRTITVIMTVDDSEHEHDDARDLAESVYARLADEAGYLADGCPLIPEDVQVFVTGRLSADLFEEGLYEVADYVATATGGPTAEDRAAALRDGIALGSLEEHEDGCAFGDGTGDSCTC